MGEKGVVGAQSVVHKMHLGSGVNRNAHNHDFQFQLLQSLPHAFVEKDKSELSKISRGITECNLCDEIVSPNTLKVCNRCDKVVCGQCC